MLPRVSPPLRIGDQGDQVVNLQNALRLLVEEHKLKIDDPAEREKLLHGLARERDLQLFGDNGTLPLVQMFQDQAGLPPMGEIDEPTAEVINRVLSGQEEEILVGALRVFIKTCPEILGIAGLGNGEGEQIRKDYESFLASGTPTYGVYSKVILEFSAIAAIHTTMP